MHPSGDIKFNSKILVVVNPIAGSLSDLDEFKSILHDRLEQQAKTYQIYETTGKEDLAELTREASRQGIEIVLAAGGDGTVAGVINGLVHSDVMLGILPMGTGNGLARAMEIPLDLKEAADLAFGENSVVELDVMHTGDRYFILNVGTGVSSRSMKDARPDSKRRFGIIAYIWTILGQLFSFQPQRFKLQADGKDYLINATEILISNGTLMEDPPDPLGPPNTFFDGQFEVYIIRGKSLADYLRLVWDVLTRRREDDDNKLRQITLKDRILIESSLGAQPVQGDGELHGYTPVEVKVVPKALKLIVPKHIVSEADQPIERETGSDS
jgi:diacylglycerol kinase (ATP)